MLTWFGMSYKIVPTVFICVHLHTPNCQATCITLCWLAVVKKQHTMFTFITRIQHVWFVFIEGSSTMSSVATYIWTHALQHLCLTTLVRFCWGSNSSLCLSGSQLSTTSWLLSVLGTCHVWFDIWFQLVPTSYRHQSFLTIKCLIKISCTFDYLTHSKHSAIRVGVGKPGSQISVVQTKPAGHYI